MTTTDRRDYRPERVLSAITWACYLTAMLCVLIIAYLIEKGFGVPHWLVIAGIVFALRGARDFFFRKG